MLPNYQNGTYLKKMQGDKRVHFKQCEKIWVQVRHPLFASIEGEIVSFTDLHINVEKNAARFILPKGLTGGDLLRLLFWKGGMNMDLIIGGVYEHYKGNKYCVIGLAKHSETLEEMIVYRKLYDDYGLWVRPKEMFLEGVMVEGNLIPRFRLLQE
ncbi:hypothetical protein CLNEO_26860 [Anaerotignum neopropionicum]|uniref:DUF1653 domain-containing protein n=2 Tax=Anaerotignum neopropionicum TaxID=36847 RepID=A0A136WBV0_9FIRM|nr:hypothetical protein CLNEO_26860 [Anaerotignum neopropionicum]